MLIIEAKKKADLILLLKNMLYIYYSFRFKKSQVKIYALINSDNKMNDIVIAYMAKLGLKIQLIDVKIQKIDCSTLEIFDMVLVSFQVKNKLGQPLLLQKIFLVANTNVTMILGMLFLTHSNVNILFY